MEKNFEKLSIEEMSEVTAGGPGCTIGCSVVAGVCVFVAGITGPGAIAAGAVGGFICDEAICKTFLG